MTGFTKYLFKQSLSVKCIVLLTLLALISACSNEASNTPTSSDLNINFPVRIIDSNGTEVIFHEPPSRILAYDSVTVEILYALGEEARIAGVHNFVTYPEAAKDLPKMGDYYQPNNERILEIQPDLVSVWYASSLPELKELKLKTLYLAEPKTISEIPDRIRIWGKITGTTTKAEIEAAKFQKKLQRMMRFFEHLEYGPSLFHDSSDLWTAGPDTLIGQIYSLLKVENIAHDTSGYSQMSMEILVERNPDIIITTFPNQIQKMLKHPAMQSVSAVKQKKVMPIEAGLISVAGPRYIEAVEHLAKLIYPELF
jgi:iron complex transport system substrate-binding protein